jgi:PAS domain S-box-containing protein
MVREEFPNQPANLSAGSGAVDKLLSSVVERVSDGFVALDTDWRYVYVNQKAAEMLNREKPEDLIGKHIWTEYPEGVGQPFYHACHKAAETQEMVYLEAYYQAWDRWFENRIYPSPDGLTIYFTDITERKQAGRALREAEDRLGLAVKAAKVGLWDWDLRTNQVYYSPEWKKQIGYEDHEIANDFSEWQSRVHPEDLDTALRTVQEFIADPYPNYQNEFRFRHKDGSYRWILAQADVLCDEQGKPIRMLGSHVDITKSKRDEAELRESEQRFFRVFRISPVAIGVTRLSDARFVDVNEAMEDLTGYSRDELIGKTSLELNLYDNPQTRSHLVQKTRAAGGYKNAEFRLRRKSGELRDILVSSELIDLSSDRYAIAIAHDITERKQAEEALRLSEERLRMSTQIAHVAVWEYDLVADQMHRSSNHDRLYGLEEQDRWVIQTFLNATHPDDRERSNRIIQDSIQPGGPDSYSFDFRVIWPDQTVHWLAVTGEVVQRDPDGVATLIRGALIDITERKQAEEELRLSEELFSSAFHVGPAGMTITRIADGKFINANAAFCEMFEFNRDDVIGHTSTELNMWTPEERKRLIQQQIESGGLHNFELEARTKSGRVINVLFSSKEMQIKGEACHLTTMVNITERKRVELALRRSGERLAAINRLDRIISSNLDINQVYDNFVSELRELLPLDRTAILRFSDGGDKWQIVHQWTQHQPSIRSGATGQVQGSVLESLIVQRVPLREAEIGEKGTWPETAILQREGIHSRMLVPLIIQGHVIGVLTVASRQPSAYSDEDENIIQTIADQLAIAIQNSELYEQVRRYAEELEQRVAERTAQLAAKNRELETFTYTVSHDLKAPLRGIDGYSRLLLEDYLDRLDEEGRSFVQNIRIAADQMNQLIEDLLAYSRLERRPLQTNPIHLQSLARTLLSERAAEIKARGVMITLSIPDTTVSADPDGLAMTLRNLLDNALKFTRHEEKAVIEIGGRETEKTCILWVRDNGIGFDMKYHDRIFEIFQRLHRVEEHPGTGIGLAIVQKAMQRMGGRTWAESEVGSGATFYLEIPK